MTTRQTIAGAAVLVLQAAVIGLAANVVSPKRLAWVRVPLSETRRVATSTEVLKPAASIPRAVPSTTQRAAAGPTESAAAPQPADPAVVPRSPSGEAPPAPAIETAPIAGPPAEPGKAARSPITRPSSSPPGTRPSAVKPKPMPVTTAPASPAAAPAPPKAEALFTTMADAKALFDRKEAVFVDARRKEDYSVEHIPGALSLFVEDVDTLYSTVMAGVPKDRKIVTYCSDAQCETAIKLADGLVAHGYKHVFILLEGIPGWKEAGYPTATGATP